MALRNTNLLGQLGCCACVNANLGAMALVGANSKDAACHSPSLKLNTAVLLCFVTSPVFLFFLSPYMSLLLLDCLTSIYGFHRHKRDGAVKDWRPTAWLLLRIVAAMQVPRLEPIIIKEWWNAAHFGLYRGSHCYIFFQHSVQYRIWRQHAPTTTQVQASLPVSECAKTSERAEQQQQINTKIMLINMEIVRL